MAIKQTKPKRLKKRVFNLWITSLISISLVLTMLGLLGLILVNGRKLSDYVREKIGFTLVLHDNVKPDAVKKLQENLNKSSYVKSTRYIDKETAGQELTEQLGEDFTGFLGFNPLFESIEVKLFANYTDTDSLQFLEKKFLSYPQVKEVYYQKDLVQVINDNINKITLFVLVISVLLTVIFVALINNTIRISVYSQRFTINTMQMVGASNSFIRKPFLIQSLMMGFYGSVIASTIILTGIYLYRNELHGLLSAEIIYPTGIVFAAVFILGVIFSYLSTYFAVNKFLGMKFDEMFY
ncbi:MAG: cell division transport system permease [Prolixibacteraceae bacterium]|nr:MAG: cell division transport system permease [Prolixibacteraceae bacterium]